MAIIAKPEGQVAAPNNPTAETEGSVAAPNTPAAKAEGSVAAPNTPAAKAEGSVAAPNTPAAVAAAGFPRTITPLVNMDFAASCFAQCSQPVLFEDLFTYSRNSSASFINRRIVCGKAEFFLDTDFVGDVENLILRSEEFDNASWAKTNSSVNPNATNSPFSNFTADKLIESTDLAAGHRLTQSATVTSGVIITTSVYAKANGRNHVALADSSGDKGAVFDLITGVLAPLGTQPESSSIEPAGDGWFLCTVGILSTSTSSQHRIALADSITNLVYDGDGVSGVFIFGAQLTESSKPLPYVKTISSPVTETFTETLRVEYDPVTGENLGALIEGGSTNLALRSEEFDNASWTKTRSSITANNTKFIDGTTSADKLVEDSTAASTHESQQVITATDNLDYTFSIFAKRSERNWIALGIVDKSGSLKGSYYDLANGVAGGDLVVAPLASKIELIDDDWYKLSITVNASTGGASITARIHLADNDQGRVYNGDGSSGLFIGGAQVEQLSLASSYIRTEGSTVSRAADDLTLSSVGNFKEQEYSIFSLFSYKSDLNSVGDVYSITDGTTNNRVLFRTVLGGSSWLSVSGGVVDVSGSGPALTTGEEIKQISTLKNGAFIGYINGVSSFTDPSSSPLADHNVINIGSFNTSSDYLFGHVKKISVYDKLLTAQEVSLL